MKRFGSWVVLVLFSVILTGTVTDSRSAPVSAQEKVTEPRFIELDRVAISKKRKDVNGKRRDVWVLRLQGTAKRLPAGTKVEFQVVWRREVLERHVFTIDQSKRVKADFDCTKIDGCIADLFIRTSIAFDRQTPDVRKAMEKRPEDFWINTSPWGDSYLDKSFRVGTEEDLQKQNADVKKFFEEKLRALIALDNEMTQAYDDAKNKVRFVKGDKLDEKGWQQWMAKNVRKPVGKIQKEIGKNRGSIRFFRHKRDLETYLVDIANAVARRSVDRSKLIYKRFELPVAKEDISHGLDVNTRKKPRKKWFKQRIDQLCESQGLEGILELLK